MRPEHPFDPETLRIDTRSGPVSYTDSGEDGPTIVLVHGLPGSVRDFRWLEPALEGLRVIRLDLPGFGGTPLANEPGADLESRGRFVAELIDALALSSVVLAGHSMGGGVATAAARQSDRVVGLALIASIGARPNRGRRNLRPAFLAKGLRAPLLGRLFWPVVERGFRSAGFRVNNRTEILHTLDCVAQTRFEHHAANLEALGIPTLVAWAKDDALVEDEISTEVAEIASSGPRLSFETGGHNIQKSQAVELGAALRDFAVGLA